MTDADPSNAAPPADADVERIIPPEQPPMDDAAGGPQADDPDGPVDLAIEDVDVDDLSVQGGE